MVLSGMDVPEEDVPASSSSILSFIFKSLSANRDDTVINLEPNPLSN